MMNISKHTHEVQGLKQSFKVAFRFLDSLPTWLFLSIPIASVAFGYAVGINESLRPMVPIIQTSDFSAGMLLGFGVMAACVILMAGHSKPKQEHFFSNPFLPLLMVLPVSLFIPLAEGPSPVARLILWGVSLGAAS